MIGLQLPIMVVKGVISVVLGDRAWAVSHILMGCEHPNHNQDLCYLTLLTLLLVF